MPLQSVSFTKPGADPQRNQFDRQRRLAEVLQAQAFQPEQTQMAGGYAVPQGILSPVAKIAQAWAAKSMGERADKGEQDYVRQQGARRAEDIARAMQAGQAVPEQPAQDMGQDELTGENRGVPAVAGRAPDPQAIYRALAGSEFPELQSAGMSGMLAGVTPKDPVRMRPGESLVDPRTGAVQSTVPMQPNWERFVMPDGKGGERVGVINRNAPDPVSTFVEGGVQPARMEMVNTGGTVTPVNPYQPPAGPLEKSPEIPAGFTRGPDGRLMADPGYIAGRSQIAAAGAPRVNVNNLQEREEAKTVGGGFGKQFNEIQAGAMDAAGKISRLDRLDQLLEGVTTGKLTPAMTQVSALADSLGIKLDPKLGAKQAVQALSNEVALQLRNPSGGAGMPGALSDKDREFLVSMTPGLANTAEGNKLIIESARKLAKREQDVARLARDYRQRKGQMDEGFYQELAQFSVANPLFGGGAIPGGQERRASPRPGSGRVVVEY